MSTGVILVYLESYSGQKSGNILAALDTNGSNIFLFITANLFPVTLHKNFQYAGLKLCGSNTAFKTIAFHYKYHT